MIPEWICVTCGEEANYKSGKKTYCTLHWNYGEPDRPITYRDATGGSYRKVSRENILSHTANAGAAGGTKANPRFIPDLYGQAR